MSLENPDINFKLKMLLASRTRQHILQIIKDYNEYCKKNDLKDSVLKGYSKSPYNTKEGLVDFVIERLSDEEKEGVLNKIEETYLIDLFKLAEAYIQNENEREKLETIVLEENAMTLKFKGWQWESEIDIEFNTDQTMESYTCSCRIGRIDGFCSHLATGVMMLIKENKIDPEKFLFKIPEASLKQIKGLQVETKEFEDIDIKNADIVLGDDYLISVRGNLVTMQWGGSHEGKGTKDVTKEKKPVPVDEWVAKKVVEKILAPLRSHTTPREVHKDSYGVVQIILGNEKLISKLTKKFSKVNEEKGTNLPETEEELKEFLKKHI